MNPTCLALANQFDRAFESLRDIIQKVPDGEWTVGVSADQVPAKRAHHAIASAGRHCLPKSRAVGYRPTVVVCSRTEAAALLDRVADDVRRALSATTDAQLSEPSPSRAHGDTVFEHWLYALRHLQYHIGQLSSTLRERRLRAMKWR